MARRRVMAMVLGVVGAVVTAAPGWAVDVEIRPTGGSGQVVLEVQAEDEPAREVKTDPRTGAVRLDLPAGKRVTVRPVGDHAGEPRTFIVGDSPMIVTVPVAFQAGGPRGPFASWWGPRPEPASIGWTVEPLIGINNVPTTGFGFTFEPGVPGTEEHIERSQAWLPGPGILFNLNVPVNPLASVRLDLSGTYAWGESQASVAPGTVNTAILYYEPASNGATGIGLGTTGYDLDVETDFLTLDLGAVYTRDVTDAVGLTGTGFRAWAGAGLGGGFSWLGHQATERSPTFDIRSGVDLDAFMAYWGPRGEAGVDWTGGPWTVGGRVFLNPAWAVRWGTAEQDNRCAPCPAPQQDFTATVKEKDSGLVLRTGAGLSVARRFGDVLAGIGMTYEWTCGSPRWHAPALPGDAPDLSTGQVHTMKIGLAFTF